MANGPNGPMTPEEKQAREDRLELLRREKEAAAGLSTSLDAVNEALQLGAERTLELNEKNKERLQLLEKQTKLQALGKDLDDEEGLKLQLLTQETKQFAEALKIANEARREEIDLQKELLDVTQKLTGLQLNQLGTVRGLTTSLIDFATKLDAANVELAVQTGYTTALQDDMEALTKSTVGLGIGVAGAGKMVAGLNSSFSLFITESDATRQSIAKTTAQFSKMGVSAEESGQALDTLTRGMGFSTQAAESALKSFDKLGQEIGLPTSQMVKDFNTLGPQLSRYGKQSTQVFQRLSKEARKLGISVKDAFDISEKFDTFEGAADLAGKLNAQIGLQLNSVEMMTASHEDRLKIMRQEFMTRGKNFDEMSVRQKQAVAEVMGVDVDMASRLFGDPVALRKYQKEQKTIAERAEAMTTAMDQFKTTLEEMFISLAPVINAFMGFVKFLGKAYIPHIVMAVYAVKGLAVALAPLGGIVKLLVPKFAAWATGIFAVGTNSTAATAPVSTLGAVSSLTGRQMMALGVAVALVGVGIGAAAFGASYLVEAFTGMGAEAIAAVAGILAFGGALYFATPAIVAAGTAGAVAAVPLLALGAAMMMAGVGVGFMAQGLAMLVEGFAELAPHFLPLALLATPLAIGLFLVSKAMLGLAVAMIPLVNPITLFAMNSLSARFERMSRGLGALTATAGNAGQIIGSSFKTIATSIALLGTQIPTLYKVSLGLGAMAVALNVMALSFMNPLMLLGLTLFMKYLFGIAAALALIAISTSALDSLEKIITVSTSVSTSELDNMTSVMGEVRHTMAASKSADREALMAMANATQGASSQMASKVPIKLVVNDRVFAETVIDLFDREKSVTNIA
jgi:hypothetical protein